MKKTGTQPDDNVEKTTTDTRPNGFVIWLKRLGIAGFLFFLIKGILWLTVGAAVLRFFGCED